MAEYQDDHHVPTPVVNVFIDYAMPVRIPGFLRISEATERNRDGYVEIMQHEGQAVQLRVLIHARQAKAARAQLQHDDPMLHMAEAHATIRGTHIDISVTRITTAASGAVSQPPPARPRHTRGPTDAEQANRAN